MVSSCLVSGKRSGDESDEGQANVRHKRKRRSRWAPETEKVAVVVGATVTETSSAITLPLETAQPVSAVISGMSSCHLKPLVPSSIVSKL
jgi:hypothetical protein